MISFLTQPGAVIGLAIADLVFLLSLLAQIGLIKIGDGIGLLKDVVIPVVSALLIAGFISIGATELFSTSMAQALLVLLAVLVPLNILMVLLKAKFGKKDSGHTGGVNISHNTISQTGHHNASQISGRDSTKERK